MLSETTDLSWLDKSQFKSVAARRFADFCQHDMTAYEDADDPDKTLYREAAELVLQRIEKTASGESA